MSGSGYLCKATEIIGVEIADEVGSLNRILLELESSNISIDYTYLCFNRDSGMPIIILHTEDIYEVQNHLSAKGFTLL